MTEKIDKTLEPYIERLYSNDANDRVKAASELGEIGTPAVAPTLLDVAYKDEASTVRQMAIQSYSEILGVDAIDEIIKASTEHFDEYVRLYAVMVLGRLGGEKVVPPLTKHITSQDYKVQAAALKAMIHAETTELGNEVFKVLKTSENNLVTRNCIEALSLWKYKDALPFIKTHVFDNDEIKDIELKTISAFYLSTIGDKSGSDYLSNGKLDNYLRIAINDVYYKGKEGLLEAAKLLSS